MKIRCSKRFLSINNVIYNIDEIVSIHHDKKGGKIHILLKGQEDTWFFPSVGEKELDEIFNFLYEADMLTPEEMSARQLEQKGL